MDKLEEEIFWLNRYDANVVAWYWVFIGILDIHDTLENEPFNTYSRLEFAHVCNDMSASSTHVQHMVTGANTMPHVDTFSRDAIEEGATATHSNARRVNSETMILPSWTYSVLLIHPERYVSERSYRFRARRRVALFRGRRIRVQGRLLLSLSVFQLALFRVLRQCVWRGSLLARAPCVVCLYGP